MNAVEVSARLVRAVQKAWADRWVYLAAFLVVFFLSFSFLLAHDWIPTFPIKKTPTVSLVGNTSPLSPNVLDAVVRGQEPVKIEIPSIKLSATIANPTTTNVEKLDTYLLKGAVRYPTSGLLGQNGNIVLFAHSSYLPIVNNIAYKTFDGIQNLKAGDRITVYSSDHAYTYSVDTVENQDANSDAIPLTVTGSKLTLATCDSFGAKSDRFVVTATLVESHVLGA